MMSDDHITNESSLSISKCFEVLIHLFHPPSIDIKER